MIKRDVKETICEYDNEGKLIKKTVIETHEEEEDKIVTSTYQTHPYITLNDLSGAQAIPCRDTVSLYRNDSITATNDLICNKATETY